MKGNLLDLKELPIFDSITIKPSSYKLSWLSRLVTDLKKHQARFLCKDKRVTIFIPEPMLDEMYRDHVWEIDGQPQDVKQFLAKTGAIKFFRSDVKSHLEDYILVEVPMNRHRTSDEGNFYKAKIIVSHA